MRVFEIQEKAQPLVEGIRKVPAAVGKEVVLETVAAGVCHSDVHLHEGFFDLGGGNKLPWKCKLPTIPGHEILGRVIAHGEKAQTSKIGSHVLVYPWLPLGLL
eukprot:TRINITY_DN2721_c0_g1_i2.p1 TRINITY_DN2721_c0_g1~~TRINITY_DN2721_c0_g1_i2.p1  ORF type:complete len:103 (+),score=13.46 TRINITY_DN2721_c0_g1_i2:87-395(+)